MKTIVKAHGTAKAAWDALNAQNDTGMASRLIVLEQQLSNLKMEETENVTDFCDRAQRIRLQLQQHHRPVPNERIIAAILHGLLPEFRYIGNTLSVTPNLSINDVVAHLRTAEFQIASQTDEKAVILKAKVKRDMSKVKCFRCHQYGHYKRNCPKTRGRGRHGQQGAEDKMALAAVVVQEKRHRAGGSRWREGLACGEYAGHRQEEESHPVGSRHRGITPYIVGCQRCS